MKAFKIGNQMRTICSGIFCLFIALSSFAQATDWDSTHVLNEKGLIEYIEYRNAYDAKIPKASDWRVHYEYDEEGKMTRKFYTDLQDSVVISVICDAPITKWKYDKNGGLIEEAYFGKSGNPAYHDCNRFHKRTFTYDEQGRLLKEYYFLGGDSFKNGVEFEYDGERKKPQKVTILDGSKEVVGYTEILYDEQDREVEHRLYSTDGKLKTGKFDVAYQKMEYSDGLKIVTLLNADGEVLREYTEKIRKK